MALLSTKKRTSSPIHLDFRDEDFGSQNSVEILPRNKRKRIVFGWYGGKFSHLDSEPLDWETHNLTENLFAEHHRNIEEFKYRIEQFERFKFVPLSYPEFWEMYENAVPLEELICKVRERYGFRKDFLDHYQELVLSEPDSAVSQSLKEAFLK